MGKTNSKRRESAWLTIQQLADALDVTEGFVRREVLRRTPADMIRRETRPMRIYARGAIEAWLSGASKPEDTTTDAAEDIDLTLMGLK